MNDKILEMLRQGKDEKNNFLNQKKKTGNNSLVPVISQKDNNQSNSVLVVSQQIDIVSVIDDIYNSLSVNSGKETLEENKAILEMKYGVRLDLNKPYGKNYEGQITVIEPFTISQGDLTYLMSDRDYDYFFVKNQTTRKDIEKGLDNVCHKFGLFQSKKDLPCSLNDERNGKMIVSIGAKFEFPAYIMKGELLGAFTLYKHFTKDGKCMKKELLYCLVNEGYGAKI